LLKPVENSVFKKTKGTSLTLRIKSDEHAQTPESITTYLNQEKLKINTFMLEKKETGAMIRIKINNIDTHRIDHIIKEFQLNPSVNEIYWEDL
jgi:(p)ppGpp synthase/HD superfamily hydrolase